MNLLVSIQTELIKTKRSAALWLAVLGAGAIPLVYFIFYLSRPDAALPRLQGAPWEKHFMQGWQAFSGFLLPMFVILICSLVPQIEYKNNAWKQVFASPQSIANIFLSKYIAIMLMILLLFVLFSLFMILAAYISNMIHPELPFTKTAIPWAVQFKLSARTFLALLAIISIQYWFSLRFRNFIVPIGLGLGLLVMTLVAMNWEHINKLPYAFPYLTFSSSVADETGVRNQIKNHEIYSFVYFLAFSLIGYMDMRMRKERG